MVPGCIAQSTIGRRRADTRTARTNRATGRGRRGRFTSDDDPIDHPRPMKGSRPPMRPHVPVGPALLAVLAVTACTSATPGWTYAPAPPATPVASAAPSASAGASASAAPSASAGASAAARVDRGSADPGGRSGRRVRRPRRSRRRPTPPFQIEFDNKDAGVPHNVALQGRRPAPRSSRATIFTGVATRTYDVPALDAGRVHVRVHRPPEHDRDPHRPVTGATA